MGGGVFQRSKIVPPRWGLVFAVLSFQGLMPLAIIGRPFGAEQ